MMCPLPAAQARSAGARVMTTWGSPATRATLSSTTAVDSGGRRGHREQLRTANLPVKLAGQKPKGQPTTNDRFGHGAQAITKPERLDIMRRRPH